MPFCPKCKNEYRPGIKMCSDCKVELVEDLNAGPRLVASGPKESLQELLDFFQSQGFMGAYLEYIKERDEYEVYCDKNQIDHASKLAKAFNARKQIEYLAEKHDIPMEEMTPDKARELMQQEMEAAKAAQAKKGKGIQKTTYVDKRERAADYKSSGFVLLFVGILGLGVLIGMYTGLISGFESLRRNYMFMGVMSFLFVVFIIVGIMSFTKIKSIISQAEHDEALMEKVKEFMNEKLTKDVLDGVASKKGGVSEEEAYFQRAEYMEKALIEAFPDMEEALCEKLMDERYNELYEDNNY